MRRVSDSERARLAVEEHAAVLDGETVAVDETGRPSFNALQNYGSINTRLLYFVFDMMVVAGRDLRNCRG
jgi:bifunctional non-homologous end joining protein LigD